MIDLVIFARVLIVEDDPDIARLLAHCLGRVVDSTVIAPDAESAIAALQTQLIDLILIDWMLPGMSGIELCRRIRAGLVNPGIRETPVLMVTARGDPDDLILGLQAGADDYLVKPFDIDDLLRRAEALLRRSRQNLFGEKLRIGALEVDLFSQSVTVGERPVELERAEFFLLVSLLGYRGKFLSRERLQQLLASLGNALPEGRSIDSAIFSLRQKIGSASEIIEVVRGVGYRIALS